ncbi:TetR/AcrR family transcriptional regulator [Vibrio splendidus]|uniref:TetR/AcrR family transcriptional regulator n=1 Tax=Vibrio splendidus TaxID=29497 RepID=UPI000769C6CC|nr:TetR/AcrR family transcriptional regulator [Vibrio splendidus]PHX04457.1 Bacterial regulatory protein, tetR family [Vibrio splendidus]
MKVKESIKKKRIMESSLVYFSKYHYNDVRVTAIAKSAKVPASLLYYYYENKEQLLLESYAYVISERCLLIKDLNFKKLVLVYSSIFIEHHMYALSIHDLLSKNEDVKNDLNEVIYSYFRLCEDIEKENYELYRVALVSLFAHPGIMLSRNEANFTTEEIIATYQKILK